MSKRAHHRCQRKGNVRNVRRGPRRRRLLMKIVCHPNHSLCSRETRVPGHAPERDDVEGEVELRPVLSFLLRTPLAEKMLILII